VYSDPAVIAFIDDHFVPVRVHVKNQADDFKRLGAKYNAQWTPAALVIDAQGEERHRIEGFLPATDFHAQLTLGLGHSAFARSDFAEAERRFREVVERYPDTESAAEAQYWAGVSRYKATGDPTPLKETAQQFQQRYQGTSWAKKASVWN
jgi:TolA-binding protein